MELPPKKNTDFLCHAPRMKPRWVIAAAGNLLPLLSVDSGDDHNHSPADFCPYIPYGQEAGVSFLTSTGTGTVLLASKPNIRDAAKASATQANTGAAGRFVLSLLKPKSTITPKWQKQSVPRGCGADSSDPAPPFSHWGTLQFSSRNITRTGHN